MMYSCRRKRGKEVLLQEGEVVMRYSCRRERGKDVLRQEGDAL